MAQHLQQPVVLICTSGTAALNFAPAVAEAFYQKIPLLVLTADRPKEWIGQADGQAIMQENIFEPNILKSYSLQISDNHIDSQWHIKRILNEAILRAKMHISGPIHINFGFREPFYPTSNELPSSEQKNIICFETSKKINSNILIEIEKLLLSVSKILVISGQNNYNKNNTKIIENFTKKFQIPIIPDINSNLQNITNAVIYSDSILPHIGDEFAQILKPELLITFGNQLVSKNLKQFIKRNKPTYHIHIQDCNEIIDTFQTVTHVAPVSFDIFFRELITIKNLIPNPNYLQNWQKIEKIAQKNTEEFTNENPNSELAFVRKIINNIPNNSFFHTANSLSVRYLNILSSKKTINFCNRGTSGIDGCTSTALGAAIVADGLVTLLTGDVAFFYDRNAFWNNYVPSNFRIILLNNQGGAIFRNVDGAKQQPELNDYFVGKHTLHAQNIANENNLGYIKSDPYILDNEILSLFFEHSKTAKILEIETNGEQTPEMFAKLKETILQNLKTHFAISQR